MNKSRINEIAEPIFVCTAKLTGTGVCLGVYGGKLHNKLSKIIINCTLYTASQITFYIHGVAAQPYKITVIPTIFLR